MTQTTVYLERFFRNMSMGESAPLRNRELRVIQQTPSAQQKFVASAIGKSERTVKTITARLTEQGIIRRSKRKGRPWEIINDWFELRDNKAAMRSGWGRRMAALRCYVAAPQGRGMCCRQNEKSSFSLATLR